jgi:hypothetical protein
MTMTMSGKEVSSEIVTEVKTRLQESFPELTDENITAVLTEQNTINAGEYAGTVVRDDKTGNVAVRVIDVDRHLWRVVALDGGQWNDPAPKMDWPVLYQGTAPTDKPIVIDNPMVP